MLQYFSYFGYVSEILHPFTLQYYSPETNILYLNYKFVSTHHIACSIVELIISISTCIMSIIIYNKDNNRLNNLRLFIGLITIAFLILNLAFLSRAKKCNIHKKTLLIYSTCVHISCYKLLFYLIESIIRYEYTESYADCSNFIWVFDSFFSYGYIFFIDNTFILHFCSHMILIILILVIETFFGDNIQFSFIFLCSFLESFLTCLTCYLYQKKDKLEFYHNLAKFTQIECVSEMMNSGTVVTATFKHNHLHNYNNCLLKLLQNSKYKQELDNSISSKSELIDEKDSNYLFKISSIIKKLLFLKIKVKNENIFFLIKEQLNNIQKDDSTIQDRINGVFTTIRENKQMFQSLVYLGIIEYENTHQQYSVFIHVNQETENISYIALGLDFPIEVSQNLEMLSKISILNSKITHEIKNPLAAIQTLVSEIKTFTENTGINDVINKLDTIYNYTEYMRFITKDFEFYALKLNNLSEQRNLIEVDIKRVNFYSIVDFSVNLIRHIWKNKNSKVIINKEIDQNISEYINTDEIRVKQIIINLLSNSLKFTKMGSVTLTCKNEDQNFIMIMVTDTGVGMKQDQVKALNRDDCIFMKSTENNKMGSGLGLSIVKDMVKILGSNFQIDSRYNEGTKISFLLNKNISMNIQNSNTFNSNHQLKNSKIDVKINKSCSKISKKKLIDLSNLSNSNIQFIDNNMDNSKFRLGDETTKREDYVLLKPTEPAPIRQNGNNEYGLSFGEITKKFRKSKPNLVINKPKARMSVLTKPRFLNLPAPTKQNSERDFSDSYRVGMANNKKVYALVVEDDQILRNSNVNVITKFFTDKGIDIYIDENTDGIECLYNIFKGFSKEKKYTFIVTDEEMNAMNGTMMTNIIRNLVEGKRFYPIKIYLSSGNNIVNDEMMKKYEGIFPKPLTQDCVAQIFKDNFDLIT